MQPSLPSAAHRSGAAPDALRRPSVAIASLGMQAIASPDGRWACYANQQREVFVRSLLPALAAPMALGVSVRSVETEGFDSGLVDCASFASRANRLIVAAEDAVHIFDLAAGVQRLMSPWSTLGMPLSNTALAMLLGRFVEHAHGHATLMQLPWGDMVPDGVQPGAAAVYLDLTGVSVTPRQLPEAAAGRGNLLVGGRWWAQHRHGEATSTMWRLDAEQAAQTLPTSLLDSWPAVDESWLMVREQHTLHVVDLYRQKLSSESLRLPTAFAHDEEPAAFNFGRMRRDGLEPYLFSGDRQAMFGCIAGALWRWTLNGRGGAGQRLTDLPQHTRPLRVNHDGRVFLGAYRYADSIHEKIGLLAYRLGRDAGPIYLPCEDYREWMPLALNDAGSCVALQAASLSIVWLGSPNPTIAPRLPGIDDAREMRFVADEVLFMAGNQRGQLIYFS